MKKDKNNKVWQRSISFFRTLVTWVGKSARAAVIVLPRRVMSRRLSFSLAIGVIALVFGFRILALITRPSQLEDIATELGSVAEFWEKPAPNKAGSKIVFQQSTKTGVGLYLLDIPSGRRGKLYEQNALHFEKERQFLRFLVWGWSPDDQHFVYSRSPDGKLDEIVICDGNSGQTIATLPVATALSEGVWLSPSAFAYALRRQDIYKIEQKSDKGWSKPGSFRKLRTKKAKYKIKGLVALSQDTVAWQEGQAIWAWKFDALDPEIIWRASTNTLVDFSMDASGKQFLLHYKEDDCESFASWYLPTQRTTELGRITMPAFSTNRVVWFQGLRYACLEGYADHNILHIGAAGKQLPFDGGINSFVGSEGGLYVTGSRAGEPAGIWKYDAISDSVTCVASNPQSAYRYAKTITPLRASVTNDAEIVISYRLWSPPRVSPDKSYPLLIGWTSSRWNSYPAVAANGGAYFASIEKDNDGDWTQKALPLYEHLKKTLRIDRENLVLYGTSAGTPAAVRVLEANPEIWKGLVLFGPGAFPNLSVVTPSHKILLDFGEFDRKVPHIMKYQDEAARAGILITAVRHENEEHVYRTTVAISSRDKALMTFLFNP